MSRTPPSAPGHPTGQLASEDQRQPPSRDVATSDEIAFVAWDSPEPPPVQVVRAELVPKVETPEIVVAELSSSAAELVTEAEIVWPEPGSSRAEPKPRFPRETGDLTSSNRLIRAWFGMCSAASWCFGALTLFLGLSFLATLPILQFLSLGYLLEASGRVSRSGRIRDAFVGVRKAARVGSIVLGTWLWLWPLRLLSDVWYSAYLIDPTSKVTTGWRVALVVITSLVVAHLLWAWYRGGKLRHFLWPAPLRFCRWLFQGGKYTEARDAVWGFVVSLRLPSYFWLGVQGFVGALAWLFIPVLLFIGATEISNEGLEALSGLFGGSLLMLVLIPLPFLQAHFAAERRFAAMFEVLRVFKLFCRAPLAFWFGLLTTLLFAIPLYLLKIEFLPREIAMIPSLVFIAFIFPARLITGWAMGLARHREPGITWKRVLAGVTSATLAVPVVASYVFIVFFTRYTSWYGAWSMFEQHAFMVPAPFLGG